MFATPDWSAARKALARWYRQAQRDLPWRRTAEPYPVWVSEVMLQQTRVAAALPYYQRFLERFPTVEALAAAPEQDLLAAWSGLGYYSRARNMQKAARQVVAQGGFPRGFAELRALAGIGDYTAAAIASICFGLPHAVLDGNVIRVLARLLADPGDTGSTRTRRRLAAAAQEFLDCHSPAAHNQALMELGALVCLPRQPDCPRCPLRPHCSAHAEGRVLEFPVKLRKQEKVEVALNVLVVERAGKLLLWQRTAGEGRMAGFWELPSDSALPGAIVHEELRRFRHTITHHHHTVCVFRASIARAPRGFVWVARPRVDKLPLSTIARKALGDAP